jgi:hypothetical protein
MTDGTDLGGCVKSRIPWPDGRWGVVLAGAVDDGRPYLQVQPLLSRSRFPRPVTSRLLATRCRVASVRELDRQHSRRYTKI